MAYLYGAAVQGIQDFIFETDKLKEVVGASELVEHLCTDLFDVLTKNAEKNMIVGAAGNVKAVFTNESDVMRIVRLFPKRAMEVAHGVAVSQAVVNVNGQLKQEHVNELEELLKIQRNKATRPIGVSCAVCERNPRTGKPAVIRKKEDGAIDLGTKRKIGAADLKNKGKEHGAMSRLSRKLVNGGDGNKGDDHITLENGTTAHFPFDIDELVGSRDNSWIAIVHADGNGLGKLIQQLGKAFEKKPESIASSFHKFSEALDKATTAAAKAAFDETVKPNVKKAQIGETYIPMRPVILGGDDLTVIIRADLALDFTAKFLQEFQVQTKKEMAGIVKEFNLNIGDGLTACAGVAFIKSSYPFHFGYGLAEKLCAQAKKASKTVDKERIPASLSFFRVQSSLVDDWNEIVRRELTVKNFEGKNPLRFDFGPYSVGGANVPGMPPLSELKDCAKALRAENSPKAGLRRWLTELHDNGAAAASLALERLEDVTGEDFGKKQIELFDGALHGLNSNLSFSKKNLVVEKDKDKEGKPLMKSPVGDILALLAVEGR